MAVVFLSHSSRDKKLARRIAVDLTMSGLKVWFDEWKIQVGHSISQRIEKGLTDADFVIVLLTPHGVASGWVEKEWRSKIGDEASSQGIFILPLLAEDCEVPILMKDKKYADIRTEYQTGLRELISAVRAHASKPVSAGARISSGRIVFERISPDLPIFRGLINTLESGCFERFKNGLKAHIQTVSSHQALQDLGEELGLNRFTLESNDFAISSEPSSPTRFSSLQNFSFPAGKELPDITTGKMVTLPFPFNANSKLSVYGVVEDGAIVGDFSQVITYGPPFPLPRFDVKGRFTALIEFD